MNELENIKEISFRMKRENSPVVAGREDEWSESGGALMMRGIKKMEFWCDVFSFFCKVRDKDHLLSGVGWRQGSGGVEEE